MRNITRCDICNEERVTDKPRVPDGYVLFDNLDFCKKCYMDFRKLQKGIIKNLQRMRYKK